MYNKSLEFTGLLCYIGNVKYLSSFVFNCCFFMPATGFARDGAGMVVFF